MKTLNKIIIVFVFGIFISFFQSCSKKQNKYDLQESKILKDKIVWSPDSKLKWSDFTYDESEKNFKVYTKVGISARYNVHQPILFRSKTIFSPSESIASDTSDLMNLRIAQAKFDLLETYRRTMEKEVDSFRNLNSNEILVSDFDKMTEHYYDEFEKEWESYKKMTPEQFFELEESIKNRLE